MRIIIFEVAGQRFALAQEVVSELVNAVTIAPLPKAPAIVEGVIDVRGTVAPVLDLRARFGLPAKALDYRDHMIVAWAGERTVVIRSDRVLELAEVAEDRIADSGAVVRGSERLFGIARMPDGLVLIHDLRAFLTQAESEQLAASLREPGPP